MTPNISPRLVIEWTTQFPKGRASSKQA